MKQTIIELIDLAKRYAELAKQGDIRSELAVINVTYDEIIDEVYSVRMGNISVTVGITQRVTFFNPLEVDENYLNDALYEYSLNYKSLQLAMPIIQEKHRYQEVDRLQKQLDQLLQVA